MKECFRKYAYDYFIDVFEQWILLKLIIDSREKKSAGKFCQKYGHFIKTKKAVSSE